MKIQYTYSFLSDNFLNKSTLVKIQTPCVFLVSLVIVAAHHFEISYTLRYINKWLESGKFTGVLGAV